MGVGSTLLRESYWWILVRQVPFIRCVPDRFDHAARTGLAGADSVHRFETDAAARTGKDRPGSVPAQSVNFVGRSLPVPPHGNRDLFGRTRRAVSSGRDTRADRPSALAGPSGAGLGNCGLGLDTGPRRLTSAALPHRLPIG